MAAQGRSAEDNPRRSNSGVFFLPRSSSQKWGQHPIYFSQRLSSRHAEKGTLSGVERIPMKNVAGGLISSRKFLVLLLNCFALTASPQSVTSQTFYRVRRVK